MQWNEKIHNFSSLMSIVQELNVQQVKVVTNVFWRYEIYCFLLKNGMWCVYAICMLESWKNQRITGDKHKFLWWQSLKIPWNPIDNVRQRMSLYYKHFWETLHIEEVWRIYRPPYNEAASLLHELLNGLYNIISILVINIQVFHFERANRQCPVF